MNFVLALGLMFSISTAWAQETTPAPAEQNLETELNPFDPDVEKKLQEFDEIYEQETGLSPFLDSGFYSLFNTGCKRQECAVWAQVVKSTQRIYLYEYGQLIGQWPVSTGKGRHGTPNFDKRPNGRIYDRYTSSRYPGGDFNGLGNMPYAVFIEGGFAIHGTPKGNWAKLGQPDSHGCVRVHPDVGLKFNRMVRAAGIQNVWITIQN